MIAEPRISVNQLLENLPGKAPWRPPHEMNFGGGDHRADTGRATRNRGELIAFDAAQVPTVAGLFDP